MILKQNTDEERLKVIQQLAGLASSNVKTQNNEDETDNQFPLSDSEGENEEGFFNRNNPRQEPNVSYCRLHFVSNSFFKLEVGKFIKCFIN